MKRNILLSALILSAILGTTVPSVVLAEFLHYKPIECRIDPRPEGVKSSYELYPVSKPLSIGVVSEAQGDTWINRKDPETGTLTPLLAKPGTVILATDTLRTGRGRQNMMTIETHDKGMIRIGDDADVYLQDYVIEDGVVKHADIGVAQGWMRFKAAHIQFESTAFQFHTPTMTYGIRGTAGVVYVSQKNNSHLNLTEGKVDVCRRERDTGKILEAIKVEADDNGTYVNVTDQGMTTEDAVPQSIARYMPEYMKSPMKPTYDPKVIPLIDKPMEKKWGDTDISLYNGSPWMRRDSVPVIVRSIEYNTGWDAVRYGFGKKK